MDPRALIEQRIAAAAAWYIRLQENVDEEDWRGYCAWLEADPQNRNAFDAVLATSNTVG